MAETKVAAAALMEVPRDIMKLAAGIWDPTLS